MEEVTISRTWLITGVQVVMRASRGQIALVQVVAIQEAVPKTTMSHMKQKMIGNLLLMRCMCRARHIDLRVHIRVLVLIERSIMKEKSCMIRSKMVLISTISIILICRVAS